ncbi:V-set and transmembrane domain-containing protein 4a isoform X2 [Fundulus heteroclitus]|uniref:V-set and transmembrane domain-containing protein 4a isoform X2 n=1 Tax=Fundulus heteroclitus TaxID=8078 RepID=UPI00165C63A8|nr:V-set and transmembrane domain-containing protein 4a isoform X2 [Fundulus heteroclitus]
MHFSIVVLVLTKTLVTEVCHTLNVTVTPGPLVLVAERDNLTLCCRVSERKWSSSVLILRWLFSPLSPPTLRPPVVPATSPTGLPPSQFLIVRIGIKKIKQYGNYSRRFPQPKFRLFDDAAGEAYRLLIANVTGMDQGFYSCRVQEIRKYRNTWRASSNGTGTTQLTVHFTPKDGSSEGLWLLFADVYLCAVLICSLGLLSIFLFSLVLTAQYLHRRHRLKASYLFVKCPESRSSLRRLLLSSGETVTSSSSCSSSPPRTQRRQTRQQVDRGPAVTAPKPAEEPLFQPPVRAPAAAKRPQKPRRLKTQPRRSGTSRVSQEDSLTYAELELVRPKQDPPASSSPDATPSSPDTVYAQILFQEEKL